MNVGIIGMGVGGKVGVTFHLGYMNKPLTQSSRQNKGGGSGSKFDSGQNMCSQYGETQA